jgi:prepilin-type N-terminal cleavage/methylation domain-containing protein/prepilin-type processing-associated H-X9-DG protein
MPASSKDVPMRHDEQLTRCRAFALIELLVVIAIIAIMIGLLLPAVQKVREASNRAKCQSNLKQLALAAHAYHDANGSFPAGYAYSSRIRASTWAVLLSPYLEQAALAERWQPGVDVQSGGRSALQALVMPVIVCPSDALPDPAQFEVTPPGTAGSADGVYLGLTSYGPNAGTLPYSATVTDGVFHNNTKVRLAEITDGTSGTLLFGEHSHFEPLWPPMNAYNSDFAYFAQWSSQITWLGAMSEINYRLPASVATAAPAFGSPMWLTYYYSRVFAYGSNHPGGANTALADGSVRFIAESLPISTLKALSTRAGGEVIDGF